MRRVLRLVGKGPLAVGVLLGAYIGYASYLFATAKSRVMPVCAAIRPGIQLGQLQELAALNGLGPRPQRPDGLLREAEVKTMGRFGCNVEMKDSIVSSSTYRFLD